MALDHSNQALISVTAAKLGRCTAASPTSHKSSLLSAIRNPCLASAPTGSHFFRPSPPAPALSVELLVVYAPTVPVSTSLFRGISRRAPGVQPAGPSRHDPDAHSRFPAPSPAAIAIVMLGPLICTGMSPEKGEASPINDKTHTHTHTKNARPTDYNTLSHTENAPRVRSKYLTIANSGKWRI